MPYEHRCFHDVGFYNEAHIQSEINSSKGRVLADDDKIYLSGSTAVLKPAFASSLSYVPLHDEARIQNAAHSAADDDQMSLSGGTVVADSTNATPPRGLEIDTHRWDKVLDHFCLGDNNRVKVLLDLLVSLSGYFLYHMN